MVFQVAVIAREEAEARLQSERPLDCADLAETPLVLLWRSSGAGRYERVRDTFKRAAVACNIVADASDLATALGLL